MRDQNSPRDPFSPEATGLNCLPRVYFARAIDGQGAAAISSLTLQVNDELMAVSLELVDPTASEPLSGENTDSPSIAHYRAIVDHDLAVLRTCDAVLMDMSITGRSYIGCICEMTYAYLWGIPCAVYIGMQDTRRPWLHYHAAVFQQRSDAIAYLLKKLRDLQLSICEGKMITAVMQSLSEISPDCRDALLSLHSIRRCECPSSAIAVERGQYRRILGCVLRSSTDSHLSARPCGKNGLKLTGL
jgi:hypothetical protein